MTNYCSVQDLLDYDVLQYPYFKYLKIDTETIRPHFIDGWVCVVGVFGNDTEKKLFDIWAGFNYKYLTDIHGVFKKFSDITSIEIK